MKSYLQFAIFVLFLFSESKLHAQVLTYDHGKVEFYTTTIMSDIDAISEEIDVRLDTITGEFEIIISIKSFDFEYELMQEHFNEKYIESDKFPKAMFKGKIIQDISNLSEEINIDAEGIMTIHGVTKEITIMATISRIKDFVRIKSKIPIVFKDYNVDEPSILTKSVAKDVEVKSTLYLK